MIDPAALLADTRRQVVVIIDDLRSLANVDADAAAHVAGEYERARAAGRTAFGQAEWAEGLYAQIAVAWVLGAVLVRFCEDNDLIAEPLLGGPGIRGQVALEHRAAHLRANPAHDDRHWLREVFGELRSLPATGEVFGDHNLVWAEGLWPSADAARQLREELTRVDPDTGALRHDFTDPTWDTRFLGDLYQDLSEHAKKTYALLQTPRFVESFILDRTLDPAIATFGLADTTIIDPTCGSGHFLLGAFDRLFARWCDREPGTNRRELAKRSLAAIGGIDLNPFAASIARFRLLLAALRAGGDTTLVGAPAYEISIAVGDSLLHGDPPEDRSRGRASLPGLDRRSDEAALVAEHGYEAEDVELVRELLARSWSAVVGNPPYITVKDSALNQAYRARYATCSGKYSLGVPFTERFWQLASSDAKPERAGFVGLITTNSFMKREMGKKLIEKWVPANDLTQVIDTSGAYIPGHGTPTVILLGRNRAPVETAVRAVMGIRGEPSRPDVAEDGLVWTSITRLVDEAGSSSDYVSVVDLDRSRLATHPWSIGGGGAAELKELLSANRVTLGSVVDSIGPPAVPGTDEAFVCGDRPLVRGGVAYRIGLIVGDTVRDFASGSIGAGFPYNEAIEAVPTNELPVNDLKWYWPRRKVLSSYTMFGQHKAQRGLQWHEWGYVIPSRLAGRWSIGFAEVATHNHFALVGPGRILSRTAPAIQFPPGTDHDVLLGTLAVLGSSAAEFWMKQVFHNKGASVDSMGARQTTASFENFFQRDATKLKLLPLPYPLPTDFGRRLDQLASELASATPEAGVSRSVPTPNELAELRAKTDQLRGELVAAQERLDWECYRLYGLLDEDLTTLEEPEPPLQLGERAFEIVLARRMARGEVETTWFERHRSTPITELPAHWPDEYRRLVERRIEVIETDLNIGLIEQPEYKRRWASKPWDEQVKAALEGWLLDRLEDPRYWSAAASITTVARLTAELRANEEFVSVARLYAGRDDVDLAALVAELVKGEAVPYLAALRYSDSGLRKHAEWLATWELQRREDAGEDVGTIPVPPKYGKPDFTGVGWEHRGKLDVPKERFVSYPGAERETDASAVIGWAGWNHLDRARALATWYLQAKRDGRDVAHLTPLLAGLAELLPWLRQWYDDPDSDPARNRPATQIAALLDTELRSLGLTVDDLDAWRPEPARRGRRRSAS